MRRTALAALMQRAEGTEIGAYLEADPKLAAGAGAAVRRVGGVICLTARNIDEPFLNRALGFGTIAEATPALLERVERHYRASGKPPRLTVAGEHTPRTAVRLLERRGYAPVAGSEELIYVYDRRRLPAPPVVDGLVIERAGPREAELYGQVAAASFPERGPIFRVIIAALVGDARRRRSLFAYLGRVDGEPAATGMLFDVRPVGAIGNGSVLPAFRGRGIQAAMIAHRMRIGWERGRRLFFAQTQNPVSGRNMEGLGWRLLYTEIDWARP